MKKTIIKCCVFAATFLASLIIASLLMNRGNTNMTVEMEKPRLPQVCISVGQMRVNVMQGYLADMDEKYMRSGIIPVEEDRKLSFCVLPYGSSIEKIAFEVRSIDGSRLVEDTEVTGYQEADGEICAQIVLKDLIDAQTEYSLIFKLTLEGGEVVSYYTRIIQAEGYQVERKLQSVADFSAATFDGNKLPELKTYMESSGDDATLARVTIKSSLDQLGWGKLNPEQITEPVYTIQDIAEETAAITSEYLVCYTRDGAEHYACVKEVYRIRMGAERMYLLNFERTMEEIFPEEAVSFADENVILGIRDENAEFVESEGGKMVAFSQGGVLFCLNMTDQKLSRLFSFYDRDNMDERSLYTGHDFRILQVDEAGNVVFLVYGYISRGRWEGYCGTEVYLFNSSTNTIEELAFLPSSRSPEILEAEIDRLAFINGKNELYLFLNDQICCVQLEGQSLDIIAENVSIDSFRVSESNRMIVWQNEGEKYGSTSLTLMNLSSGEKQVIRAKDGDYILPLGFMEEDLIYGTAHRQDVTSDKTGMTVFPMYRIVIQDENGKTLMGYEKEGIYVTDCTLNGNQIVLTRVEKDTAGGYTACAEDQIVSGAVEKQQINRIITVPAIDNGLIVQIQLKTGIDSKKIKFLTPKEVLYEGSREIQVPEPGETAECYYVYGLDGKVRIVSTPGEAITIASGSAGTVIGRSGTNVWKKERMHTRNQIMAIAADSVTEERNSLAVCLDTILAYENVIKNSAYLLEQGKTVLQILEKNLENTLVLDLEGCSMESVLYYPDRETPVLAILADGSAVLIIGFNEQNVVLMNPESGSIYKMGMNDATKWFEENGNVFISYTRK